MSAIESDDPEDLLVEDMARFYDDPLGFVMYAFEWGAGELAAYQGPREWQRAFLIDLGDQVKERRFNGITPVSPIQDSTVSGHGIGKSALTAWVILWIMSTRPGAKGIVTANTSDQLRTKTWAELGKWWRRCITRHWFDFSLSKGNMSLISLEAPESWRCDAQTCREENSEAFAGLHAATSTPFYIFDEASAVPDKIWEVAAGGLTDGEPMFFAFGNGTRNTGRFHETHGRLRHRWQTRQIDSRKVEGTNHDLFQEWIEDFGEDSDFVRVRVRGMFPRAGSLQFIAGDVVLQAMRREPISHLSDPLIMAVDVARFGDDQSVIGFRRGRDARTIPAVKLRQLDTMQLVGRIVELYNRHKPSMIFVDEGGVGGGVVDRLRQLGFPVIGVQFGAKADFASQGGVGAQGEKYANKRAEIYGSLRQALKDGLAIEDDPVLEAELTSVEYGFNLHDEILLERKESMKKRGLASPDWADMLALTYAYPVAAVGGQGDRWQPAPLMALTEYDPFANLRS